MREQRPLDTLCRRHMQKLKVVRGCGKGDINGCRPQTNLCLPYFPAYASTVHAACSSRLLRSRVCGGDEEVIPWADIFSFFPHCKWWEALDSQVVAAQHGPLLPGDCLEWQTHGISAAPPHAPSQGRRHWSSWALLLWAKTPLQNASQPNSPGFLHQFELASGLKLICQPRVERRKGKRRK